MKNISGASTGKSDVITGGLGSFSKRKFEALVTVRARALGAIRTQLERDGYLEVSVSSLVNIAGSCENPHASFTLPYYGREAHLSQSAQLQLEALVIRLRRGFYTVNNSFREEHFDDPEAHGRRLSEFTLIEPEKPYIGLGPEEALAEIMKQEERTLKYALKEVLEKNEADLDALGADVVSLRRVLTTPFNVIRYDAAVELLNAQKQRQYAFGDDFGVGEERKILQHFASIPTFVTHYPAAIKFFNMKRTPDGRSVYSADLLMPKLGETTGGAVREEDGEKIRDALLHSRVAQYVQERGGDVLEPFREYFALFKQEPPVMRGGFGIGFERFVGFLLGSNDILETIAHRAMQP